MYFCMVTVVVSLSSYTVVCEDALLHEVALLVVATGDAQDLASKLLPEDGAINNQYLGPCGARRGCAGVSCL